MTVERSREVIENYEKKHGKIKTNFIIFSKRGQGTYTVDDLKEIIKNGERKNNSNNLNS